MSNKIIRFGITLLAAGLSACSLIQPPATLDPNALATSVSGTLTAVPVVRTLPPEATGTVEPAGPTTEPAASDTALPATSTDLPQASATPTPLPSDTPAATPTVGPTSTLPAGDIRNTLGNPTYRDTLSAGNNWPLGADDFTSAKVEDGELHLTGLSTIDGWRLTWPLVKDFYLEMSVSTGNCTGSDRYGLMARVPDKTAADRGYLFGLTCDGRYSLRSWNGPTETMTQLINLTSSTAIVSGSQKVNRVGLWAKGEQLALYVNGTLLTQIQDSAFVKEGAFGIFVGARQTENFTIHVDEIAYWENP